MRTMMRMVVKRSWLPTLALAVVGCQRGPSPEVQRKLDELTAAAAQKDSLLQVVAGYSAMMSDVSAELAKVQVQGMQLTASAESPMQASRDSLVQKIRFIETRVKDNETQLRQSRTRIRQLTSLSDSLRTTLEKTIANFEGMIASQEATIASLNSEIGSLRTDVSTLRTDNEKLVVQQAALVDTVHTLATENNTVYYIVGKRDELLRKGVIVKEGGSHFLFIFGKRGQVLQPNRELNPRDFVSIDRRFDTEIPLPDANKEYRIVSRQDVSSLATQPNKDGEYTNTNSIKIAAPKQFWSGSKFLIIVEA